jgi:hypothetical protein
MQTSCDFILFSAHPPTTIPRSRQIMLLSSSHSSSPLMANGSVQVQERCGLRLGDRLFALHLVEMTEFDIRVRRDNRQELQDGGVR